MTAVSIIMPCHNRGHDLARMLSAYDAQDTSADFEVIAVDDASTDSTYEILKSFRPSRYALRVQRLEKNQGPGMARNQALALANGRIMLIVGADILPQTNFIRVHLQAHALKPGKEYAILGRVTWADDLPINTLMEHIDGIGAQQFSYHYLQDGNEYDYRHFYTANISVKRELLAYVDHWFDPDFTYAAFEDIELGYRLKKYGMRILYWGAPVGQHLHYHTIWTFSRRQYHAGLMACIMNLKHPGAAGRLPVLLTRYCRVVSYLTRFYHTLKPNCSGAADWLEMSALHLASFYEWMPNPLLDELYLKVLAYFWHKGVIDGTLGETGIISQAHDAHACIALVPILKWFIHEAQVSRIPLPQGFGYNFLDNVSRLTPTPPSGRLAPRIGS